MFRVALSCTKRCRGHLINTKQSRVNSDAAQVLALLVSSIETNLTGVRAGDTAEVVLNGMSLYLGSCTVASTSYSEWSAHRVCKAAL